MENPFIEISQKLDTVLVRLAQLEQAKSSTPERISFADFCKTFQISRPTGYAWADRGLIRLEKIGGRNFVPSDSITISKKYQRKELA